MEDSMDTSKNCVEQEGTSTLTETESNPTEWTDEKHCLFLKSMESTFVNQLYKSIEMFGWQFNKNSSSVSKSLSNHKLACVSASSGQFKVLRDGCWSKIDFVRDESEVDQEALSKVPLMNPWIKHYRNSQVQPIRKFPASHGKGPLENAENQSPAQDFQPYFTASNIEMTDQNFNDEAIDEEKSDRMVSSNDHLINSASDRNVFS